MPRYKKKYMKIHGMLTLRDKNWKKQKGRKKMKKVAKTGKNGKQGNRRL